MRLLFPVAIAFSAAAFAEPAAAPDSLGRRPPKVAGSECPDAARYFAHQDGKWQDGPLQPRKLGELPPAEGFAAMLKTDERGCMVPVKYRDVRR